MNEKPLATYLGYLAGVILVAAVIGGLFALLVNFVLSYIFVAWPVTWANWGITWISLGIIGAVLGGVSKNA